MKVIDLLNIWVEDRDKLPEKIKIEDKIFEFDKGCNLYKVPDEDSFLIQNYLTCAEMLYKEVEVIEENKEIEEIDTTKIFEFTMDSVFEWNNEMKDEKDTYNYRNYIRNNFNDNSYVYWNKQYSNQFRGANKRK